MRSKFVRISLLLVLIFTLLLSGIAHGKTKINFWNGLTGPDGQVMYTLVEEFNATYPDIEVEQQQIEWNTYWDKLLASLVAGTAPEVFIVHINEIPVFQSKGVVQPLDRFLDDIPHEDRIAEVWDPMVIDGQCWAIPLDLHPIGTYYNVDLFKAGGVPEPSQDAVSREDFVDAMKKLTKIEHDGKVTQYGMGFPTSIPWFKRDLLSYAAQNGATLLNEEGTKAALNSPGFAEALKFMKDMLVEKYAPTVGDDSWAIFQGGKQAMYIEGPWNMLGLTDVRFDWSVAPFPTVGSRRAQWMSSHAMLMPRGLDKDKQQAAWTLMKFLSDKGVEWAKAGQIPARHSQIESAEFAQLTVQYTFSKGIPYAIYEPIHPKALEIEQAYAPTLQLALIGEMSIEEALAKCEQDINRVLSE